MFQRPNPHACLSSSLLFYSPLQIRKDMFFMNGIRDFLYDVITCQRVFGHEDGESFISRNKK